MVESGIKIKPAPVVAWVRVRARTVAVASAVDYGS